MEERIRQYIKEIEKAQGIKVLLACETGSRAWGFPSPDSDYDVRLIYRHRMDWYLSLLEPKDTFEVMLEDNNFDISGWDIRKTLGLLWKSNPPLLERIQSPIVYVADEEFLIGMNSIAPRCYSRVATIHHYLSMAKKCFEEINGKESYKLKKFFMHCVRLLLVVGSWKQTEFPRFDFLKCWKEFMFREICTNV